MLITNLADGSQKFGGGRVKTTFTLYRFDNDCRDIFRRDINLEHVFKSLERVAFADAMVRHGEGYMVNLGRKRAEQVFVRRDFAS